MVSCVAYGCTNRSGKPGITFHSFPKDAKRRALWTTAVRRDNWQPSSYSKLCSVHFQEEDLDRTSLSCVRVREHSVPTIFPAFPPHLREPPKKKRRVLHKVDLNCTAATDPCTNSELEEPAALTSDENLPSSLPESENSVVEQLRKQLAGANSKNMKYKKKIKILLQKNRRLRKITKKMSSIINELKKKRYVDEDNLQILKSIPGINEELLKRQISKNSSAPVPRSYGPVLRSFALTLNFYSPQAYEYVRSTFNTCLPHQRTLSKWYRTVDGAPGFSSEAFQLLKEKVSVNESGFPILCTLLMDEVAIKQHVEFDGSKFYGYVDNGSEVSTDSLPVAKEALVFLLVGVNGNWKIPVGYFLIAGLSGNQKANLVKRCLCLAFESGVKVISLTCDGAASNRAMAMCLGCSFEPSSLKSVFSIQVSDNEEVNVAFFLDPSHCIKLVRNTLGDKKVLCDGDKQFVRWSVFEKLHEMQEKEGLHLANKVRTNHIHFQKNKMKVKFATQLLSESVADAIDEASNLKLDGFCESQGTVKFVRIMNCVFDIFNSRNMFQCGWKKPVNMSNVSDVMKILCDARKYILELRIMDTNEYVVRSNRQTGFIGFLINIQSLQHLVETFLNPATCVPVLKYLPTYKISQDHLEMMFSLLRSRGGWNNNPTSRQFMSAFRKLLVQNELREIRKGNCIPLESIPILSVASSTESAEQKLNITTSSGDRIEGCLEILDSEVLLDHDYFELSSVVKCISVYISGFVVKCLESSLQCSVCISALRGEGNHDSFSLIRRKNKGGLIIPSDDVVEVCVTAEKVFRRYSGTKLLSLLENNVLRKVMKKNIFKDLHEHMKEQLFDNHLFLLIKAIANRYFRTRLTHAVKLTNDDLHALKIRPQLTKYIIFQGQ